MSRAAAIRLAALAAAALLSGRTAAQETPTARRLFERYADGVVEVRTIAAQSGAKRSIGTGFRVGDRGEIATNYHVISELVMEPERYRAELRESRGNVPLVLLAFDVVNDVAILRGEGSEGAPLRMHRGELRKGERVFALGNPYDIGMSIVEGTYNGKHEHARNERIHFTGALNPGMSGGPALLTSGEVMGMNVASAGEGVAFLVPIERVRELLARARAEPWPLPPEDWTPELRAQLFGYQQRYVRDLFERPAPPVRLGPYRAPGGPAPYFDCWGDATQQDGDRYESLVHECDTDDWVFISEDHLLAPVWFRHRQLGSRELSTPAFFELYSSFFEDSSSELAGNDDLFTPFRCRTRFVDNGALIFKTAFCARAYRRLEGLYDVVFKAAALGRRKQGLETVLVLSAVSFENAERLARRYLEQFAWSG